MPSSSNLRYVDPRASRGPVYRAWARFVASPVGFWLSRNIGWNVDPYLLHLSRGHLGTGLIIRTGLLETRGVHTGRTRRNGVIYFHDGERVTIIASKAGAPEHPSWFYNARANPDVRFGGQPFRAEASTTRYRGCGSGSLPTASSPRSRPIAKAQAAAVAPSPSSNWSPADKRRAFQWCTPTPNS
jgi:hypothetical protein